jgi:hypothetical protein
MAVGEMTMSEVCVAAGFSGSLWSSLGRRGTDYIIITSSVGNDALLEAYLDDNPNQVVLLQEARTVYRRKMPNDWNSHTRPTYLFKLAPPLSQFSKPTNPNV